MRTKCILLLCLFCFIPYAFADDNCSEQILSRHPEKIISCYTSLDEQIDRSWVLHKTEHYGDVRLETYTLNSQFWPKQSLSTKGSEWQHTLLLYRPDEVKFDTALLVVSGGTRYHNKAYQPTPEDLAFIKVASLTNSIIVNLKDVPNQFLSFDDNVPRKEDGIIAYTWNKYLDNATQNMYWPAHLPMTKAVIKTMDAVSAITQNEKIPIKTFVLTGASKRGWTVWLTLLSDERVKAIIPIVIDIFNMKENIDHIYQAYNGWPEAFHDYVEQGVVNRINTPEFNQLIKIEDPLAYLQCNLCAVYEERLSKPKFIISASQDQFFPPDSLKYYVDQLPGETMVRMVPNQGHSIDARILVDAVGSYYHHFLHQVRLPKLKWEVDVEGTLNKVMTNLKPQTVKLWQAENPDARDFRYETGIRYQSLLVDGNCKDIQCEYQIKLDKPKKGWKAYFVEFQYGDPLRITLTTPAYIMNAG